MAATSLPASPAPHARPTVSPLPPTIANLLELSSASPRNSQVQAYAKLEFGALSYYVQSLSVTLGRKATETDHVDIHLPGTKAISRLHARIQYSFARNAFEIFVGGRNGLFVDDVFYEQGSIVPLEDRTTIQIGEIKFDFLLPHQPNIPSPPPDLEDEDLSFDEDKDPSLSELSSATPSALLNNIQTEPEIVIEEPDIAIEKPDIPYATLIAQSLLSHPQRRRTLQEIYTWIQDHHEYFKSRNKNWKSRIRHNLQSNPAFVPYGPKDADSKVKRGQDEWGISPEYVPLIGGLNKEGDTDKLSTTLQKKKEKKPTPPPKTPKSPKPPKPPKPPPKEKVKSQDKENGPKTPPPPPPPPPPPVVVPIEKSPNPPERKEKLANFMQTLKANDVDMMSLLQQAFKQVAKQGVTPSIVQPPAKRARPAPVTTAPVSINGVAAVNPLFPVMPLPYANLKMAPVPASTTPTQMEPTVPVPPVTTKIKTGAESAESLSPAPPPPDPSPPPPETVDPSPPPPETVELEPVVASPVTTTTEKESPELKPVETAASTRQLRGKKRPLEE